PHDPVFSSPGPRFHRSTTTRVLNRFREFVHFRCRPLIVAIGTAGETACPTLLDQSFGEVGGAGGFACRWKLISIAIQSRKRLCTRPPVPSRPKASSRLSAPSIEPTWPALSAASRTLLQ